MGCQGSKFETLTRQEDTGQWRLVCLCLSVYLGEGFGERLGEKSYGADASRNGDYTGTETSTHYLDLD